MPTQQELRRRLQGGDNRTVTIAGVQYTPEEIPEAFGIWHPQDNSGSIEPAPITGFSPSPTATPAPRSEARGDNSNAGLVNRTLFDNEANRQWWSTEDAPQSVTGSAEGTRRLDPGASAGLQGSLPRGEPTVEVPTYQETYENAPSLFPGAAAAVNPFDEWWRQDNPATATTQSSGAGSIWEGEDSMGAFSGESLGNDFNASLTELQFGEGYPAYNSPEAPPETTNEGTGIPIEPEGLPQEYEWTTSPNDRRFLPGSEPETGGASEGQETASEGGINRGGTSMSNFGGNFSLGGNLYTPLELMNFGGGYPQGVGRRGDGLMTGVVTAGGQVDTWGNQIDDVGGRWVDRPDGSGADWVENARGNQPSGGPPLLGYEGPGSNPPINETPPGMTIIGYDNQNGQPIYRDGQGNLFVNEGTGTRVYGTERMLGNYSYIGQPLHQPVTARYSGGLAGMAAENARQMSAAGANPTMIAKLPNQTGDGGRTLFNTSGRANRDRPNLTLEDGMIVRQPGGRTIGRGQGSTAASYAGGLG